jgi:hypothetical protein
MDIKADLRELAEGLKWIELARKYDLLIIPNGRDLGIKRDPEVADFNEGEARRVIEILKRNREAMLSVSGDRERLRQALSNAQERMSEANRWLLTHIDLWNRLEKTYRTLFPEEDGCVRGGKCLDDVLNNMRWRR